MTQVIKCFTSHEYLNLDSQQLCTDCERLAIFLGEVGARQILGDYLPALLAETVSSRLIKRCCFKNKINSSKGENTASTSGLHMYTYAPTHT